MVVPFGGAEIYYGTNPLAFAAGGWRRYHDLAYGDNGAQSSGCPLTHELIPDTWAVDKSATTDPFTVNALLPLPGRKAMV